MKKASIIFYRKVLSMIVVCLLLSGNLFSAEKPKNKDSGYLFLGPHETTRTKTVKKGMILEATHRAGVVVSNNPESPWHLATFFMQVTLVKDTDGNILKEVALCETTDPDGDMTFGFMWKPEGETGSFEFAVGTGKWEDITGKATFMDVIHKRMDGHIMPEFEMNWEIDHNRPDIEKLLAEGNYPNIDHCFSFHGPHIYEIKRELKNGVKLSVSNQSGTLRTVDPTKISPRNYATCFDRGTTITLPDSNGDVMLLEDTDADGDVAWLAHVWWYRKGPGTYRFIGGTGKWEGITGVGVTRGMLRGRTDDHFMLNSELGWKIKK